MKRVFAVVALLLSAFASAAVPVRHDEVIRAINTVENAMRRSLGMPQIKPAAGQKRAATRREVLAEIDRLFVVFKPQFRVTPRPYRTNFSAIEKAWKGDDAAVVKKLVRWGMIAPVGPLATGTGPNMDLRHFGDALGYAFLQIANLTNQPDPRWSPDLMPIGS